MESFMQYALTGLSQGGLYALVGLGFVLIYNVTGIINFVQGEFVMLGAMLAIVYQRLGLPLPLVIMFTVLSVALFGGLLEIISIRPAKKATPLTLIIITIGLSMIVRGLALVLWGTDPLVMQPFTVGGPVTILGGNLMPQEFWVLGATAVVVTALYIFLDKTVMGKAFRACVINSLGASLMGIDPRRMSTLSFVLGAAIGAIGGVVFAPTLAIYDMGVALGVKGFIAAVLGGLTSVPGVILSGFIVGIGESFGTAFVSSGYKDAITLLILLLVLLFRPQGLFGVYGGKRV
jgi:branched-chain amino acid transport system permease protein